MDGQAQQAVAHRAAHHVGAGAGGQGRHRWHRRHRRHSWHARRGRGRRAVRPRRGPLGRAAAHRARPALVVGGAGRDQVGRQQGQRRGLDAQAVQARQVGARHVGHAHGQHVVARHQRLARGQAHQPGLQQGQALGQADHRACAAGHLAHLLHQLAQGEHLGPGGPAPPARWARRAAAGPPRALATSPTHTGWNRASAPASGSTGSSRCSRANRLVKRSCAPKITDGRRMRRSSPLARHTASPAALLRR